MFDNCAKIVLFPLLVAVATGAFARELSTSDKSDRIVGGYPVHIVNRPYLVQLRRRNDGECICGGSLVTPRHVVTARHCTDRFENPLTELDVVAGANTQARSGVKAKIIAECAHPNFNFNQTKSDDITVLELDTPMEGKFVATIDISYDEVEDGQYLTVSGWGATENGYLGSNSLARTVRVAKISNEKCSKAYSLTKSMMCAASPGKDACFGDSGGPATYLGKLVGVVSFGEGCAEFPGVYTSTRNVRDFLEKCLRK